jgi:predicted ribosome quality control (RQC) complex YloA/Tae2 family protein
MEFREITLESGTRILLGKDAESNDELMKKFKGKENTILHTVKPGSPFCVIKEPLSPSDETLKLSGAICAKYSQDWRENKKDVRVNIFTGKNISKKKGMKLGTWHVAKSETINIKKEDILKLKNSKK